MTTVKLIALSSALALLAGGCEESAAKPTPDPAPSAAAATASPPPAATATNEPEKPKRPLQLDTELTDARRAKIEKVHPEAKGFVVMKELEDKLKAMKKIDEKEAGIRAFDALAKGKWVLFTGPLVEAKDDGFSIGVSYTPRVENDPMGLSRQFFLVALTDVKGYEPGEMKSGTKVVVLAKYEGKAKAGPGFELVAERNW